MRNFCKHKFLKAKICILLDGRKSLREVCASCEFKFLPFLPMVSDKDVVVNSLKYPNKTLGEIMETDSAYVKWVVVHSKASRTLKKAAARIYFKKPYIVPTEEKIYSFSERYNPVEAEGFIKSLESNETQSS